MRFKLYYVPAIAGLILSIIGLAILGDFPRGAFETAGWQVGSLILCVGLSIQSLVKFR